MVRTIALLLFALLAAACGTTFAGDAHFPGGPRVCYDRCTKANMDMGAFIYSGEFASACVCQPRGRRAQATPSDAAALVGVMGQMRRQRAAVGGLIAGVPGAAVGGSR